MKVQHLQSNLHANNLFLVISLLGIYTGGMPLKVKTIWTQLRIMVIINKADYFATVLETVFVCLADFSGNRE